jgi:hypothetical protein
VADDPAGDAEAVRLALPIQVGHRASTVDLDGAGRRIHARSGHCGQVDDDAAVTHGVPGHRMRAATHRDPQLVVPAEPDRRHHIGRARAAGDQRRPSLDVSVPYLPGGVVFPVGGLDQPAGKVGG